MPDFSVDVSDWIERAKARSSAAFRATAMGAVERVKELTPVDTGFLRANWVDLRPGEAEPTPFAAQFVGKAIEASEAGDVIIIANPVKYARRIEFGFVGEDALGRKFNQPARGMVAQTVLEVPKIAEEAVASLT